MKREKTCYHEWTDVNLYKGTSNTGSIELVINSYRDVLKAALTELKDPNVTVVRIGEYHGYLTEQYVVTSVSMYSCDSKGIFNY